MTGRRPLRRVVRVGFTLGLLVGIGAGVARVLARREGAEPASSSEPAAWPPLTDVADVAAAPGPEPSPVRRPGEGQTPSADAGSVDWLAPTDGVCPVSHPVKTKRSTGIFHVPGGAFYSRTAPDRCYRDELSAEADGLRKAKR